MLCFYLSLLSPFDSHSVFVLYFMPVPSTAFPIHTTRTSGSFYWLPGLFDPCKRFGGSYAITKKKKKKKKHLKKRSARGDRGINPLDVACCKHDIAYSHSNDLADTWQTILAMKARKNIAVRDSILGERTATAAVWAAIKTKTKFDWVWKQKEKTVKQIRYQNVAVSYQSCLIGDSCLSLVDGPAEIANTVNDNKAAQRHLEKLKRP